MKKKKIMKKGGNYMTITAIIPALNEEISIGSMVIKTKKYARSCNSSR